MRARRIPLTPATHKAVVTLAAEIILAGDVIVYPTDTIYGIGGDATRETAVMKVYSVKRREKGKPLLVLADSISMVRQYAAEISSEELLRRYWPGPVTFIVKENGSFPSALTGGSGTIGFRIPDHKFCLDVIGMIGRPLISTSANLSGAEGGNDIEEIVREFSDSVALIVDAGNGKNILPSTVVDITGDAPRVVRQGTISIDIE